MNDGVMLDSDVIAGLEWLASTQENKQHFYQRLAKAQQFYIATTQKAANFGKQFDPEWYGSDVVAGYFAQAKSLIDNRRSYEVTNASNIIPWVKQLGVCAKSLDRITGARDRAIRMLKNTTVLPDTALLELVLAGNYASEGYEVEFIPEQKGIAKTPEFRCRLGDGDYFFVECKRLQKGPYVKQEILQHHIRSHLAELHIKSKKMNVWTDVTYLCEVKDAPENYIISHLKNFKGVFYEWNDDYGKGTIRPANLNLIREDITENGSLLVNTKLARLIKGSPLEDENYQVVAMGRPDERDSRFITKVKLASLITWRCINEKSFDARSRHVTKTLAEIDNQLLDYGLGVGHIALDVDIQKDVADKRREKNYAAIVNFEQKSKIVRLNVHYLVPRIDENSAWMVDETADDFFTHDLVKYVIPLTKIFPEAEVFANDQPGWHQN
ncbi:hypothetical protein [Escherichia coli]|uniref:hypothetical protein n=1 Tax=Escherichia coli TaxID=562 RepID=UPI000840F5F9|nr:hypothetical protein [Escherichia coli]HAI0674827.1 hypothetical protein [Escherichia coli]